MPGCNPNKSKLAWILDVIVLLAVLVLFVVFLFISFVCTWGSRDNICLGALIPETLYHWSLKVITISLNIYLIATLCLASTAAAVLAMTYMYYLTQVFTQELTLGNKCYCTIDTLRTSGNIRNTYRSFQILNTNLMQLLGPVFLFGQSAFTIFPIYGIMICFNYWNLLHPVVKLFILFISIFCVGYWLTILQLGKYLYTRGEKMLSSWKCVDWGSKKEFKIMSKFRRSCSLVLLSFKTTFVIKRITPIVFVKGVVRGTFRSMLTLNKN